MYLVFIGAPQLPAPITAVFTLSIAFLMVSRLPVFSGKMLGGKIAPEMVLPVVVLVVLFIAVLISYPWHLLTGGGMMMVKHRGTQLEAELAEAVGAAAFFCLKSHSCRSSRG